jgi:hypothetical protein
MSIWYIQSIAELKYANILYAFHEFTVQNCSTRNMKMNFDISYNFICSQQFIQNKLGAKKSPIKSTVNQIKINY